MMDRIAKRWIDQAKFAVNQDMEGRVSGVEPGFGGEDDLNFGSFECACEHCSQ